MMPIVNGLDQQYGAQVAFQRLDANTATGQAALKAYNLRGHPSYVVISRTGKVLWTGMGVTTQDELSGQVSKALDTR